jgi:hypothetical protein
MNQELRFLSDINFSWITGWTLTKMGCTHHDDHRLLHYDLLTLHQHVKLQNVELDSDITRDNVTELMLGSKEFEDRSAGEVADHAEFDLRVGKWITVLKNDSMVRTMLKLTLELTDWTVVDRAC